MDKVIKIVERWEWNWKEVKDRIDILEKEIEKIREDNSRRGKKEKERIESERKESFERSDRQSVSNKESQRDLGESEGEMS